MRALEVSQVEMESKWLARFGELPLSQMQEDDELPLEARDIFLARKLFRVVWPHGLEGYMRDRAPITDVEGFAIQIAVCPPGQGPGLHYHLHTTETFTCLRGRFRVYWGTRGDDEVILEEFDTISIPPAVIRGFQNVGDSDGYLYVLLTGDVKRMNDIAGTPGQREALAAIDPTIVTKLEARGRRFDAGEE